MQSSSRSIGPDLSQRTLAIVMAGGNGTRLGDLTRQHSKPALPFAGQFRNIDFPLSNCINSGIRRIGVATQYKPHSLIEHVHLGWSFLCPESGEFIETWPAQRRSGTGSYAGTADAIYRNLDLIEAHSPDYVLILAGDHVYKMNYRDMLDEHAASQADVTIGCVEVPLATASAFGIMQTDPVGWVKRFDEKPARPSPCPANPEMALASMGIYVFNREFLARCLSRDAADPASRHDFGRDILPAALGHARVRAHTFRDPHGGPAYWRDVGTLDSYWRANMELLGDSPKLDLRDSRWPIRTHQIELPAPLLAGPGAAVRSIVSAGCRIAGTVQNSVLSPACTIGVGALVDSCVVLPNARIGRDCRIARAIIDGGCNIPDGLRFDGRARFEAEEDSPSAEGVVLITASTVERAVARWAAAKVA
jgi:glucose-1-phosphate adenylyltransferase